MKGVPTFCAGLLVAILLPAGPLHAQAVDPAVPEVYRNMDPAVLVPPSVCTTSSNFYPQITCASTDPRVNQVVLDIAYDARSQLAPLLGLGNDWRFPVHLHIITTQDPDFERVKTPTLTVSTSGPTLVIDSWLPVTDPLLREQVQRRFVLALLWEATFKDQTKFDGNTKLDVVPNWAVEGLREELNEDDQHQREAIVARAFRSNRAPKLQEIAGWNPLSDATLLGGWQRAFCYYIVKTLTDSQDRQVGFRQWLQALAHGNPQAFEFLPSELAWERELMKAEADSEPVTYSWTSTLQKLRAQKILLAKKDQRKPRTFLLDDLASPELTHTPELTQEMQDEYTQLTGLQARAHPSWQEAVSAYRQAVFAWLQNAKPDTMTEILTKARGLADEQVAEHQRLTDYLNWFEVTHSYGRPQFQKYFQSVQEADKTNSDKPDPLRDNLLNFEKNL